MCGFAALFEADRVFDPELLASLDRDLYHRGPDAGGTLDEAGFALVFRRLAILDPTSSADQPMTDVYGRCTLVFNGEIYNYRELRIELEAAGVSLRTDGDSEVILEGYRIWGESVLERLEGMYAFALVDRNRGTALVARDPLGIKPLYIMRRGPLFAVASEMRPLRRLHQVRPDEAALAELLTFGWAAGSLSNLTGIERVPGGTLLRIPIDKNGSYQRRRFFDPLDTLKPDEESDPAELERLAIEEVGNSVIAHLASDVGYTAQLSGGVDSSVVAAIASSRSHGPLVSFGVKLADPRFDESRYRAMVTDRYELEHHEILLDGIDLADAMPKAIMHMEGPVPHGGCVMLMLLCREARKHSKVILTGEGADEMFGGYWRYSIWRKLMWQERISRLLPPSSIPRIWPFHGVRKFANRDAAVYASVYHDYHAMQEVFPGLLPEAGVRGRASRRYSDFRDRLFAVDQVAYLESLLVRQDKMSMAESMEARVPFVHLPLLKAVNRLPRSVRVGDGKTKPVLKRLADRLLPQDLVHRRKVGLGLPYDDWLSDDRGLGRYLSLLTDHDCRLAAYAEPCSLRNIVGRFRTGHTEKMPSMFWLVNLELWLRSLTLTTYDDTTLG